MIPDVEMEMEQAVLAITQAAIDRILALGVNSHFIAALGAKQPPFGIVRANLLDDGFYEPGGSESLLVQPVYGGAGMVDMVGWKSFDPSRWRLRTGLGLCLGDEKLFSYPAGEALPVLSTPLCWLQHEGKGICIVDWDSPDLTWLCNVSAFSAADHTVAELLRRALGKRTANPHITVMQEVRHVA